MPKTGNAFNMAKKKRRGPALNMGKFGERVDGSRKVNKRAVLMTDGI